MAFVGIQRGMSMILCKWIQIGDKHKQSSSYLACGDPIIKQPLFFIVKHWVVMSYLRSLPLCFNLFTNIQNVNMQLKPHTTSFNNQPYPYLYHFVTCHVVFLLQRLLLANIVIEVIQVWETSHMLTNARWLVRYEL